MSRNWLKLPELGPLWGMRFLLESCRILGRPLSRVILAFVVFYYALFSRRARASSLDYLPRVGVRPTWRNRYRHLFYFAQTSLDRFFFLSGNLAPFKVTCDGHHHLVQAMQTGRGAIVLGGHLGSFEAMRAMSDEQELKLVAVGYFKNAEKINGLLDAYGNNSARLVHVEPGTVGYLLQVKQLLEQGYLVALLGDRDIGGPTCQVELLGGPVSLPLGPYALASQLERPILLTCGLYQEPNRYELHCEPLGTIPRLSRNERDRVFQEAAQRYADFLAKYCRQSPFNWFNFYDYWNSRDERKDA